MFGNFGGGFLNMGTPELVVIGAVAWAILGPKELFRLSKEAGKFIGEWQQLGMQAKDTFASALENELLEDEMNKAKDGFSKATEGIKAPPISEWAREAGEAAAAVSAGMKEESSSESGESSSAPGASSGSGSAASSVPTLEEYAAARAAEQLPGGEPANFTPEQEAAAMEQLYSELGRPEENAQNFQDQISGARNAAVLSEYPQELEAPMDGSPMDVQSAEELLLANQIAETENDLATLQAEKQVLSLKRKQLEANRERATRMAAEKEVAEQKAVKEESEAA